MICIVPVVLYIKSLVLTVHPQEKADFPFSLFLPNCHRSLFIPSYIALIAVVCLTGFVIGTDPEAVFVFNLLECAISPVHVVFHVSPTVLGSFVRLRRHVDDCSAHLCGLGP